MIEKYLSNKYNKSFKIRDYSFSDNVPIGIYAGKHYTFEFAPIDGLNVTGKLDYMLTEEDLKYLILNITNIDNAKLRLSWGRENWALGCMWYQWEWNNKMCIWNGANFA